MAKAVTHISVFLASPGDVLTEREIAFEVVQEWNDVHTDDTSASLQLRTWQTSTDPVLGDRPQAVVNKQALDDCDIVVGIFWTRFGSPTGVAESGTEEEIRRSVIREKPVMLYFSDVSVQPSRVDQAQYAKVQGFRHEFRNTGLIWNYTSLDQFRDNFRRHLQRTVQRLLSGLRSEAFSSITGPHAPCLTINKNEGIAAHTIENFHYNSPKKGARQTLRAPGTIGTDALRKNYIGYLVRQYNEFQKIGRDSYGDRRTVSYSFLSSRIIQEFKAPAQDLPVARFDDLVSFICKYIANTIVGRNNRSKGVPSYELFTEYAAQQTAANQRKKSSRTQNDPPG
jgi:hypothetical protein